MSFEHIRSMPDRTVLRLKDKACTVTGAGKTWQTDPVARYLVLLNVETPGQTRRKCYPPKAREH